ncbi:MAG: peptidoglycan-binding protein LysM [Cocleimonas sp.]|nr:peptidoglycan-binding protein LysM [Cocleimonas sp.]
MGLFDFATNFGNKIFGDDDDAETASQKLQAHIEEDNPGVEGLQVSVEEGVATITGEAESSSAYEKAVLMAGNALGVESVEAGGLSAPEQAVEQTIEVDYYEIQKGDSLWKIADQFYGDGSKYKTIFEENREVIKDPDKIFQGQKIRIPME